MAWSMGHYPAESEKVVPATGAAGGHCQRSSLGAGEREPGSISQLGWRCGPGSISQTSGRSLLLSKHAAAETMEEKAKRDKMS